MKAGTPMEVVITGKSGKDQIRGLLLQARQGDKPVGKFTLAPNDPFAQILNCGEPGVSTITMYVLLVIFFFVTKIPRRDGFFAIDN